MLVVGSKRCAEAVPLYLTIVIVTVVGDARSDLDTGLCAETGLQRIELVCFGQTGHRFASVGDRGFEVAENGVFALDVVWPIVVLPGTNEDFRTL